MLKPFDIREDPYFDEAVDRQEQTILNSIL